MKRSTKKLCELLVIKLGTQRLIKRTSINFMTILKRLIYSNYDTFTRNFFFYLVWLRRTLGNDGTSNGSLICRVKFKQNSLHTDLKYFSNKLQDTLIYTCSVFYPFLITIII